jgi:His-Xaa-Ser system radical SAM maturase HxsC
MCCQPPTKHNDIDFLFEQNLKLLATAPKNIPIIGISGGEPTLLGNRFFDLLRIITDYLPDVTIHILTNGRKFSDETFVHKLKDINTSNIVFGIPIHSDSELMHDEIAGSNNAFNETMFGLYNLATFGLKIELRIVINKINYKRLPQLSNFIFRNLTFVSCISFMAMEYIGLLIKNSRLLWIEPIDYISNLKKAVLNLYLGGIDVSIFNLPLCLLPETLHPFAQKSISDWKTSYITICQECVKKDDCCGLFSTSKKVFDGLSAFQYKK